MDLLQTFWQTFWRTLLVNLDLVTAAAALYLIVELGRSKARQQTGSSDGLEGLDVWLIGGALIGGRMAAVIPEADLYLDSPLYLVRLNFGLSLYGAIGGGALALVLFGWRRSKPTFALADAFSLYLALGIALFHLGCLMYGFCGGKPAPLPLGVPLPGHVGLRYPSELYEGILALGLFFGLLKLSHRGLFQGGVTGLFLFSYPLIRALIDLTRFPTGPWPWADQAVSLVLAAVGLAVIALAWTRQRSREPSEVRGVP